jgi:hypothetical protein
MYRRISYLSILLAVFAIADAAAAELPRSARTVTSSEDLQLSATDHAICLNRALDPHATTVLLPPDAEVDQEFVIDDCSENSRNFQVKTVQPAGHTMTGPRILAADGASLRVRYFGDKTWRIEP